MSAATPPVQGTTISPNQLRLVFLAVASVLFLASLGQTVVTAALPIIVGELGGLDRIAWVITAYLLAATVGAPVFGKLGDMYGRKSVLQAGIGVFLLGSVLSAAAGDIWMLVAGRFVQGLGGGGLIVVSMATVREAAAATSKCEGGGSGCSKPTFAGVRLGSVLINWIERPVRVEVGSSEHVVELKG